MTSRLTSRLQRFTFEATAVLILGLLINPVARAQWAHQQSGAEQEAPLRIVKVSRQKLETTVIKALVQDQAKFYSIKNCGERCNQLEESGTTGGATKYDKDGNPWTYNLPAAKAGGLVAEIVAEKDPIYLHQYFVVPLTDCREFLRKLRAERKPISIGTEPDLLSLEYGLITMGENRLDLLEASCLAKREPGEGNRFDFMLQSVVGPFVNVMNWVTDSTDGSKPSGATHWISWNMKENRRAELIDLFDEASVIAALKADKVMQQRFFKGRRKDLSAVTEFAPLMKAIDKDPRQARDRMGWQILSYDRKTKTANVRMGFYGNCCNSSKVFKMGLNLKVRPEYEKQFETMTIIPSDWESRARRIPEKFERAFSTYTNLSLPYKNDRW